MNHKKKGFRSVVSRELGRIVSRPIYPIVMLIMPLAVFFLLWILFYQGVPRDLPIAVLDLDNSVSSRKIIRHLDSAPATRIAERVTDMRQGKDLILTGKCLALVVFPRDMENDLMRGRAPKIINYYNNEFMLTGSLIYRDIVGVVKTISTGLDVESYRRKGDSFEKALAKAQVIRTDSKVLFNPYTNYIYFMVSSLIPAILQIFVMICTVFSLGSELKNGTAAELMECSGGNYRKAVLGKLFPYFVNFIVLVLFINVLLTEFMGCPMVGNNLFVNISSIFFVTAHMSVAALMISLSANLRLTMSSVAFYSGIAYAFIGVTFPLIGMPLAARIWAGIIPLNYYMKIYIDQAMRGAPLYVSFTPFLVLLLFTFILPIIYFPRLGKVFCNEKYWGKS